MRRFLKQLNDGGAWAKIAAVVVVVVLLEVQPVPQPLVEATRDATQATQRQDYEAAALAYRRALEYAPWQTPLLTEAAQASLMAGDDEAVLDDLETLQARRPLTAEEHLLLGHVLARQGDVSGAQAEWDIAIDAGVADTDAYLQLIDWHLEQQDWETATQLLSDLAQRNPSDAAARYRLGLVMAISDPAAARVELEEAADLEPELGNQTAPLVALLNNEPSFDPAFFKAQLGITYLELEEWPLAEAAFAQAVTFNPAYGEAVAYLAYARSQRGQVSQALPAFQQAAALAPNSPVVYYLTGLYWKDTQSWPEARAAFERAYDLDPTNPGLAVEIANTHRAENQPQWAEIWLVEAMRLAEGDDRIQMALAQFYVNDEYLVDTAGIAAAQEAVEQSPDSGAAHETLGWAYFLLGDLDTAQKELEQALLLDPSLTRAHFHMGTLLELRNERAAAIDAYESAVRLDPNGAFGVRAQRALARLQGG